MLNKEVLEAYNKLDADLWAEIGKHACCHGVAATSWYMKLSTCYGLNTFQWEKNCCQNAFMGQFCSQKYFDTKIKPRNFSLSKIIPFTVVSYAKILFKDLAMIQQITPT